jgi:NSS family neurotransmitter:Na+ symporter
MKKGWREITDGSDIKVPNVFKYIIKYVAPILLLSVFIGSIPGIFEKIKNQDMHDLIAFYQDPSAKQIEFNEASEKIKHLSPEIINGMNVTIDKSVSEEDKKNLFTVRSLGAKLDKIKQPEFNKEAEIEKAEKTILYRNISRSGLLLLWLGIAYLVYYAYKKRIKEGRFTS